MYCPTTCGVADYMLRYVPASNKDLDGLQRDLESIANLTQGAEDKVVYMKDSVVSAQKSSTPGNAVSVSPLNHDLSSNTCPHNPHCYLFRPYIGLFFFF